MAGFRAKLLSWKLWSSWQARSEFSPKPLSTSLLTTFIRWVNYQVVNIVYNLMGPISYICKIMHLIKHHARTTQLCVVSLTWHTLTASVIRALINLIRKSSIPKIYIPWNLAMLLMHRDLCHKQSLMLKLRFKNWSWKICKQKSETSTDTSCVLQRICKVPWYRSMVAILVFIRGGSFSHISGY